MVELGYAANENRPKLRRFDRYGRRIDDVEFHPAYHGLMEASMKYGMNGFAWRNANRSGAHVARAAVMYLGSQADAGTGCPMSMTYAAIPAFPRTDLDAIRSALDPNGAENWLHYWHGNDRKTGRAGRALEHHTRH